MIYVVSFIPFYLMHIPNANKEEKKKEIKKKRKEIFFLDGT
jgi:hypothetical protein